jgi:hypothetical protein
MGEVWLAEQLEPVETLQRLPDRGARLAFAQYSLASILAKQGKRTEALALLQEAVAHELEPKAALGISKETAFQSLHGDPRFEALVTEAKKRGEVSK